MTLSARLTPSKLETSLTTDINFSNTNNSHYLQGIFNEEYFTLFKLFLLALLLYFLSNIFCFVEKLDKTIPMIAS